MTCLLFTFSWGVFSCLCLFWILLKCLNIFFGKWKCLFENRCDKGSLRPMSNWYQGFNGSSINCIYISQQNQCCCKFFFKKNHLMLHHLLLKETKKLNSHNSNKFVFHFLRIYAFLWYILLSNDNVKSTVYLTWKSCQQKRQHKNKHQRFCVYKKKKKENLNNFLTDFFTNANAGNLLFDSFFPLHFLIDKKCFIY